MVSGRWSVVIGYFECGFEGWNVMVYGRECDVLYDGLCVG